MLSFIKNSFRRTNDSIILITPLIIFISLFGCYFNYLKETVNSIPKFIFAILSCWIMFSGLFSAWFYMVKKTLILSDKIFLFEKDREKELIKILKSFSKGLGKYFASFLGGVLIAGILYVAMFGAINFLTDLFNNDKSMNLIDSAYSLISLNDFLNIIRTFPNDGFNTFHFWCAFQFLGSFVISFLIMLYIPEIVYKTLNPFKAFINSIKKLFKTFIKSSVLFLYLNVLYLIISVINAILIGNPYFYPFVLILFYYFIIYATSSVFTYYEWEFMTNE